MLPRVSFVYDSTISPPFGLRACASIAPSIPAALRTVARFNCTPIDGAAVSIARRVPTCIVESGFMMIATWETNETLRLSGNGRRSSALRKSKCFSATLSTETSLARRSRQIGACCPGGFLHDGKDLTLFLPACGLSFAAGARLRHLKRVQRLARTLVISL
jgi:hypothetical protein